MFITNNQFQPSVDSNILDTFKIDQNGIFLKDLHLQRTHKAFLISGQHVDFKKIVESYEFIENKHSTNNPQLVRLVFSHKDCSYDYQIATLDLVAEPVLLEIIQGLRQPAGRGRQNFKWESRNYWIEVVQQISTIATDVISLNEQGHMVETSRYNLFFYSPHLDLVYTPPLSSGCIGGVFREWALSLCQIDLPGLGIKPLCEADVHFSFVKNYQLFVANSVRGVLSAGLATKD